MRGFRILQGSNACIAEGISALVVGDLHIGIEFKFQEQGMHVRNAAKRMAQTISRLCDENNLQKIVFLGDIKDTVGYSPSQERLAVRDFFATLTKYELHVAKGNHDSHLEAILDSLGFHPHISNEILLGDYAFMHGNTLPGEEALAKKYIAVGHLHAALKEAFGYRKVFVFAKAKKRVNSKLSYNKSAVLIALPAFSDLILGSDVTEKAAKYAPALRLGIFDWDNAEVFGFDGKPVGRIKSLRKQD